MIYLTVSWWYMGAIILASMFALALTVLITYAFMRRTEDRRMSVVYQTKIYMLNAKLEHVLDQYAETVEKYNKLLTVARTVSNLNGQAVQTLAVCKRMKSIV